MYQRECAFYSEYSAVTEAAQRRMATASVAADLATCPICLDLFENAKSLPCLHAVCLNLKCLRELCWDKLPGDTAACPKCRQQFHIPQEGIDRLQRHYIVQQLADKEQERIRLEETFSDEQWDEQQAADRERQLKVQLIKSKDDVSQLQTRLEHQSKEFEDYKQRSTPFWEQELKQRNSRFIGLKYRNLYSSHNCFCIVICSTVHDFE